MLRILRLIFVLGTGIVLLTVALANRGSVTLQLLPEEMQGLIGWNTAFQLPLFLVILGAVAVGVLIGFVWEWFREIRLRALARGKTREVARLERELSTLRGETDRPEGRGSGPAGWRETALMSGIRVKICGLRTLGDVDAVAKAGAAYAGFNFFAKSPRSVSVDQALPLTLAAPEGLCKVALWW